MDVFKQVFAVLGTAIGVVSGLVTLYGKYIDLKKKSAANQARGGPLPGELSDEVPAFVDQFEPNVPAPDAAAVARARRLVKGPAIALMVAGGLSLVSNLFTAGFGYIDQFVTP